MPISFTPKQAHDFSMLFSGRSGAFGLHKPSDIADAKGKKKGSSTTVHGVLDQLKYESHLAGETSIGVIPITESDTCNFGAIDVDDYTGSKTQIITMIYKTGMPLLPFRSKSGGLHLFIFFDTTKKVVSATQCIELLHRFRELLGLPIDTEIFPKQRIVATSKKGTGSWINIPYFGNSDRKLIGPEGELVDFEDAMAILPMSRTSLEAVERFFDNMVFSDGPPCLQTIYLRGTTAARNNYLFSVGVYAKGKFGDQYESFVRDINEALDEPIEDIELEKTVFASLSKKEYPYRCRDTPLCEVCIRKKCMTRKYGIGAGEVPELQFGVMTQVMTEPPYYIWLINDVMFKFYDEAELINQLPFQKQCLRLLHFMPMQLTMAKWNTIVNNALTRIEVKQPEEGTVIDKGSAFMELVAEFLTRRAQAGSMREVALGRVFRNEEKGVAEYLFKPQKLKEFLVGKQFTGYSPTEINERIRVLGAKEKKIKVGDGIPPQVVLAFPEEALRSWLETNKTEATYELDFLEPDSTQGKY